jgi:hypothetical protein
MASIDLFTFSTIESTHQSISSMTQTLTLLSKSSLFGSTLYHKTSRELTGVALVLQSIYHRFYAQNKQYFAKFNL